MLDLRDRGDGRASSAMQMEENWRIWEGFWCYDLFDGLREQTKHIEINSASKNC
jgi:hypothetical protein